ncbi:MAG: CO dehydrogenase/acetyl-CoA synthase complex subunit epsilon [Candidatus Lokiarchaeota archaeon]|nr:CO dehydrogenase/acetyl-CoA synthase complex subunit epsilon [Candidatus Lokiarchaeota archaeon]
MVKILDQSAKIKVEKYSGRFGKIKGFEMTIGKLVSGDDTEWEPMGPTPKPCIADLRDWFMRLMKRYPPFYMPVNDICELCTFGKCNLANNRRGACGINLDGSVGKIVSAACCIGASCHSAHGDHLMHYLLEKYGDVPIDFGDEVEVEMPITRMLTGIKPLKISDLKEAMAWAQHQITHVLAAAHTGQEGSYLDYEVKSFAAGLADGVGMEISDAVQISGYGFPKGDTDAPLVEVGMGTIDRDKANILMIGHNVAPGIELVDYMRKKGIEDKVDVGAICCTAIDLTRYYDAAKVVGSISKQLNYIRTGVPDVVMVDEQCINLKCFEEAQKIKAPFIASNDKCMFGLEERSDDPIEEIVEDLASYKEPGVLLLDHEKAGIVAVEVALKVRDKRRKMKFLKTKEEMMAIAQECTECGNCQRNCPNDIPTTQIMHWAKNGEYEKIAPWAEECLSCGRCEDDCISHGLSPFDQIIFADKERIASEKFMMRAGRGPVRDTEIRDVGAPIVMGEIPGVVAIVGCANYHSKDNEVALIAEEFVQRGYIVLATGCGAMDIARYKTENGTSLYEEYVGAFERGGLVNIGSCVSNPHITGAVCKVANIFARRPLRGNFEEIADYSLSRVGAVGLAWGAMSQKAASIASHVNGLAIPVVVGPHSAEYRRMYIGRTDQKEQWKSVDGRTGKMIDEAPCPEHLLVTAEDLNECMVLMAKLCLRQADGVKGRSIKLAHWIDISKKYLGAMPAAKELAKYVRVEGDIPPNLKNEVLEMIKSVGWKPKPVCTDPTTNPELASINRRKNK